VNEHVGAALIRGDKSIALIGVKIDDGTGSNGHSLFSYSSSAAGGQPSLSMVDPLDFDGQGVVRAKTGGVDVGNVGNFLNSKNNCQWSPWFPV
jgi:hypothetical protein